MFQAILLSLISSFKGNNIGFFKPVFLLPFFVREKSSTLLISRVNRSVSDNMIERYFFCFTGFVCRFSRSSAKAVWKLTVS